MDLSSAAGDPYRHDHHPQYVDSQAQQLQPLYNPGDFHGHYPHYDPAAAASYYHATAPPAPVQDSGGVNYQATAPPASESALALAPVQGSAEFHYHAQQNSDAGGAYAWYGMNPAATSAVAAFSQLAQFAGSMGEAERSVAGVHPQHYAAALAGGLPSLYHHYAHNGTQASVNIRPPYIGGPTTGKGGMIPAVHPSKPDGGSPTFPGRGHVRRGGCRKFGQQTYYVSVATENDSNLEKSTQAPTMGLMSTAQPKLAYSQEYTPAPANRKLPGQVVWCDICRVAVNSLEMLEAHKNGKKHKKTLQRLKDTEAQHKIMVGLQSKAVIQPIAEDMNVIVAEASKSAARELPQNEGPEQLQCTSEPSVLLGLSQPETSTRQWQESGRMDPHSKLKKKHSISMAKNDGGGKRMRLSQPIVGEKTTEHRDRICTVCNAICETLISFEAHLKGKKHLSRIKKFQKDGMVYGPVTVRYPPDHDETYNKHPSSDPLFFGLRTADEVILQEVHLSSDLPTDNLENHHSEQPEEPICEKTTEHREETRICTMCNAICETLISFEAHLKGKKHLSRIKQFQKDGMVYGLVTVHFPPDHDGTDNKHPSPDPLFFGLRTAEIILQEVHLSSDLPTDNLENQHSEQPKEPMQTENAHQLGFKDADEAAETIEHASTTEIIQGDVRFSSDLPTENLEGGHNAQPKEPIQTESVYQLGQGKQGFKHVDEVIVTKEDEKNAATIDTIQLDTSLASDVDTGIAVIEKNKSPTTIDIYQQEMHLYSDMSTNTLENQQSEQLVDEAVQAENSLQLCNESKVLSIQLKLGDTKE